MDGASKDPRTPGPWEWGAYLLFLLAVLACLLAMQGCSPRIYEKVITQRDTTYIEKVRVDSVYRRDSTFIRERGDTIYIYKERVRDKYVFRRDTIVRVEVDSVAVDRIVEVQVEKPLSAWKAAKLGAFWWLLGAVLLLLVWTFRKPLLNLLKL